MNKKLIKLNVLLIMILVISACKFDDNKKTVNYCNVVFECNGGTKVEIQKVEEGKKATEPEAPVKEEGDDIYFGGWYLDATFKNKFDFSNPVYTDIVLYARWLEIPEGYYKVVFNSKCDIEIEYQFVKEGETVKEPEVDLKKNGYAFSHWYVTDPSEEFNFENNIINENIELTAKWNHSGIYDSDFEDETLYCINIYNSLETDSEFAVW